MGESCVDVDTRNKEEESLEEGILTFEVFQKNPTRREEGELEIVDILFTRIGVELVSKIVVQGNIFNLNRWREKEENEQNHHGFLLIALSCLMQIQHWNTRMNQVRRYFKKRRFTHALRWMRESQMTVRYSIGFLISQCDS